MRVRREQEKQRRNNSGNSNGKRDSQRSAARRGHPAWWLAAVFFLLPTYAHHAWAAIEVQDARAPELYARRSGGLELVPMVDLQVDLEVSGPLIYGRVVQSFENPFPEPIEAIYVFPLPERGAVHAMEMRIGERRILSQVHEREEAHRVYENARATGRKASLVEEERPNLFTTSVANIGPGEVVHVELGYIDEVDRAGSTFSLCFPLTVTPRYTPGIVGWAQDDAGAWHPVSDQVADAQRITPPFVLIDDVPSVVRAASTTAPDDHPEVRLDVWLQPGVPVSGIRSVSHELEVVPARPEVDGSAPAWRIRPEESIRPDRDFRLQWEADTEAGVAGSVLMGHQGGETFALAMLVPPERGRGSMRRLATQTLFVIDVSGSMAGPSIRQARTALVGALERLDEGDSFDILCFNDSSRLYARQFQVATPENVERAVAWARGLDATGGTEIHAALVRGLDLLERHPAGGERQQRLVFLTDGAVGNEAQVLETVRARLSGRRLHSLGIGPAPNRYLLREMAAAGHGLCDFVSTDDEAINLIDAFLRRISHPVWTDLELEWVGIEVDQPFPQTLPDLHLGEPIVVTARVREIGADGTPETREAGEGHPPRVILRRRGETKALIEMPVVRVPEQNPAIGVRWGRHEVDRLLAEWQRHGQDTETRSHVIQVATRFGLITPFTSRVAVEEVQTVDAMGTPHWVPSPLPHGSRLLESLPSGGTWQPLWRLLGVLCMSLGLMGPVLSRVLGRRWS